MLPMGQSCMIEGIHPWHTHKTMPSTLQSHAIRMN